MPRINKPSMNKSKKASSKKISLACVVLAAGMGTRMKSSLPKVLHPIAGLPMVSHVVSVAEKLGAAKIVTVIAPKMDAVEKAVAPHSVAIQKIARGTGDAVKAALPALKELTNKNSAADILVLYGDVPCIQLETLKKLKAYHGKTKAGITVLAFRPPQPTGYGRIILNADKTLHKIVEEKDATADEKKIELCNSGIMIIKAAHLEKWVSKIKPNNAQKEFYLVDLPEIAAKEGMKTYVAEGSYDELRGVNTRAQLSELEQIWQNRKRQEMMDQGVTLQDPQTVYFSCDTEIAQDVVIGPCVVFGSNVKIASNVEIRAYSHLEGVMVEQDVVIGPFARIRPDTVLGKGSRIGNFVEVKNAQLGEGVKANHLSYIGDAEIGTGTNFGCGAITVNYDGISKNKTTVGRDVMVGCNVNLVAPVTVNNGAYVAAGSTITEDVPENALAVGRSRAILRDGWADSYHQSKKKKKKS